MAIIRLTLGIRLRLGGGGIGSVLVATPDSAHRSKVSIRSYIIISRPLLDLY